MKKEKQKGITLIALIITIIVILILVAVSVRTISKSGLFDHAKDATTKWGEAQNKEANISKGEEIDNIANKYVMNENETSYTLECVYLNSAGEENRTTIKCKGNIGESINGYNIAMKYRNYNEEEYKYAYSSPSVIDLEKNSSENKITIGYKQPLGTTYTITYSYGVLGETLNDIVFGCMEEGETIPQILEPKPREGYRFMGWAPTLPSYVSADYSEDGEIVFTATWEKNS